MVPTWDDYYRLQEQLADIRDPAERQAHIERMILMAEEIGRAATERPSGLRLVGRIDRERSAGRKAR